jgi:hypothetical protein
MRRLVNNVHYNLIPEIDWARLAAYIDGEGCICVAGSKRSRQMYMKVFIANTDYRLMLWFQSTFGGTINGKQRYDRERHRPCYVWTVCSEVAWFILLCCEPYLIAKRDQADVALKFQRTMTRKRPWENGQPAKLPEDVWRFRDWCRRELSRLKRVSHGPGFGPAVTC